MRLGFLRTLLGPISLIIGTILAYLYYAKEGSLVFTLLISILAPFIINFLLIIILKAWNKALNKDKSLSLMSRLTAGTMSIIWSGIWITLTLTFLIIAPIELAWYKNLRKDVLESKTYYLVDKVIGNKITGSARNLNQVTNIFKDPQRLKKLSSTEEYRELISDKKIQALLSDNETLAQIENQEISKLISNSKIQDLMKDKEVLKKIFALHGKMMKINGETN